jgi:hypothetical protein
MIMHERELAASLQASKDDPSEWGEPDGGSAPKGKQRLAAMVSVRLAPDELRQIQQRAERDGQTVSAYLRSLAVRDLHRGAMPSGFGVSITSSGTYSTRFGNQWLLADGRRLSTTLGQPTESEAAP